MPMRSNKWIFLSRYCRRYLCIYMHGLFCYCGAEFMLICCQFSLFLRHYVKQKQSFITQIKKSKSFAHAVWLWIALWKSLNVEWNKNLTHIHTAGKMEIKIGSEWPIPDTNHFGTLKSVLLTFVQQRDCFFQQLSLFCYTHRRYFCYFRMVFLSSFISPSVSDNRAKNHHNRRSL